MQNIAKLREYFFIKNKQNTIYFFYFRYWNSDVIG